MLVKKEEEVSYRDKSLHGQFLRGTKKMLETSSHAWDWLEGEMLTKETEVLLTAAQDQALRTSFIKNKVNRQEVSPMCRIRGKREETSIKTGDTTRLLKFSTGIFVCKKFLHLQRSKTWYDHSPDK